MDLCTQKYRKHACKLVGLGQIVCSEVQVCSPDAIRYLELTDLTHLVEMWAFVFKKIMCIQYCIYVSLQACAYAHSHDCHFSNVFIDNTLSLIQHIYTKIRAHTQSNIIFLSSNFLCLRGSMQFWRKTLFYNI